MKTERLVFTVFAKDQPGIVRKLSDTILDYQGNWLESRLSRLCGQFVGIVSVEVEAGKKPALQTALENLAEEGIHVISRTAAPADFEKKPEETVELMVEANDRPGIVEEIATALVAANVTIVQMETFCESASMAGYQLFAAQMIVALPENLSSLQLEHVLENVSDDLMVSILEDDLA